MSGSGAQPVAALERDWDLLIIGGGITGAGILLEAARQGRKALLVEQRDFAWGSSSRSSKLVHGGLRYLAQGQWRLTRDSVRARQALLREGAGLVQPQPFAFAHYRKRKPGRWTLAAGLRLYAALGGAKARPYLGSGDFLLLAPHIAQDGLLGGQCYDDAKTDDARLVLRVLQEACALGAVVRNYLGVQSLLRDASGAVQGAVLCDADSGVTSEVRARVVVNATGAWADRLRLQLGQAPRLRPLRGSHLVLPAWRLPVAQAVSFFHPQDGRPVFAYPWEGATLVGTTDLDHGAELQQEAAASAAEVRYLLEALQYQFPQLALEPQDVIASFAGVRPVIHSGHADPSRETRDHAVWLEQGLLTVTGGKLTTFGLIARQALAHMAPLLPPGAATQDATLLPPAQPLPRDCGLNASQRARLQGRYGRHAWAVLASAGADELQAIPGTDTLWVELRWAARTECVRHLDDLLLRRTRLGLLLPQGGAPWLERIRALCQHELGWNDAQWALEAARYQTLWHTHYRGEGA